MGGETWFRKRASRAADDEDDAFPTRASSELRRRGDIPGPPLVGKVTARSYEVDRRGESRDAAIPRLRYLGWEAATGTSGNQ